MSEVITFTLVSSERSRRVLDELGFRLERDVEHAGLPQRLYRRPRGG